MGNPGTAMKEPVAGIVKTTRWLDKINALCFDVNVGIKPANTWMLVGEFRSTNGAGNCRDRIKSHTYDAAVEFAVNRCAKTKTSELLVRVKP
jgi:hypothetical protein